MKYFDAGKFVDEVLTACGYDQENLEVRSELSFMILKKLGKKILHTVVYSLSEHDFDILQKILEDHQELDEMDALMMIVPNIPGLDKKIERVLKDLKQEFISETKEIEISLEEREKQKSR